MGLLAVSVLAATAPSTISRSCTSRQRTRFRHALIAAAAIASWLTGGAAAQAQTRTLMFVALQDLDQVAVVDGETGAPTGTVLNVGDGPRMTAVTPDGRFVYVLNHTAGTISIIDVASLTVLPATITVDAQPISITFAPSANRAFVASDVTDSMTVIDTSTNTVVTEWGGNDPKYLTVSPDDQILWAPEASIGNMSGIDIAGGTLAHQFSTCIPHAMAITPDGTTGFLSCPFDDQVRVHSLPSGNQIGAAIPVGDLPITSIMSRDGATLYVVNQGDHSVSVIDVATRAETARIPSGTTGLTGMALSNDGLFGYLTSSADDRLHRVNFALEAVDSFAQLPAGSAPSAGSYNSSMSPRYISTNANPYDAASDTDLTTAGFGAYLPFHDNMLRLTGNLTTARHISLVGYGGIQTEGFDATLSGNILGAGPFTKLGAGTLTFSGTASHTGGTNILDGGFTTTGTHLADLTLQAGTTLTAAGTLGDVIANGGGNISIGVGAGTTTSLTLSDLTLASGRTLTIELNGTAAGTGYDQIAATGVVTLNGATLDLQLVSPFVPVNGDQFLIVSNASGTFAGYAEGATITVGASKFTITYVGGAGNNDVVLTSVVDQPPTISTFSPQTIDEDATLAPVAFTIGDTDTPLGSLIVSATSSNQLLVPDANLTLGGALANRTIATAPIANAFGQTTITITVSDGALQDTETFVLTVDSINDVPTISAIGPQAIDEDATLAPVAFTVGDVETAAGTLIVTATSSNESLVPDANLTLAGADANRTITAAPIADAFGQTTITVTVDDGDEQQTAMFVLTVTNVNDAPTITAIAAQTIAEDTALAPVAFTVDDIETPAGSLIVTATSSNQALVPDANLTLAGTGANRTIAATPVADAFGETLITVTVEDGGLQTATTFTLDVTDVAEPAPPVTTYYFAEGASGGFFKTAILIANPHQQEIEAAVTFYKTGGGTVSITRTLPAMSRVTIDAAEISELADQAFSTAVTAPAARPIAVERTMTWDATGYGAHTEKATSGAATDWYFAEGAQGFFATFLLLSNPQTTASSAHVTWFREGEAPIERDYPLAPEARLTVDAFEDDDLRGRAFGAHVTFTQPGVAERSMYFGTNPFWSGGTASAGATAPSSTWLLAEGATGSYFTTFVLATNPGTTPAEATFTYLPASGEPVALVHTIAPGQRLSVNIATEDPSLASAAVATQVDASQPIVVERSQYWGWPLWIEAHNSFGVTQSGRSWIFAEGRVGGASGTQTYLLLANPGDAPAEVTVTFLRTSGEPVVKTFTVAPTSRFNVGIMPGDGNMVPELIDEAFGARIDSTQPIAVERSLYGDANGVMWAVGTNATGAPLPPQPQ